MNVEWNAETWKTWTYTFADGCAQVHFQPRSETDLEISSYIERHGPVVSIVEGEQPNPMMKAQRPIKKR